MKEYYEKEAVRQTLVRLAELRFSVVDPLYHGYLKALADVEEALNKMTVYTESQIRTGHWIRPEGSTPKSPLFVCSICGAKVYYIHSGSMKEPTVCKYTSCPHCKANMEVDG